MELVPIITQILGIVAAVFVIVLLISFIASKVRKKEKDYSLQISGNKNQQAFTYSRSNVASGKSQYYGGNYLNSEVSLPKEIKVIKRSSIPTNYGKAISKHVSTNSNSRFTVINSIASNETSEIKTDEYGFKIYSDNEFTRSVYLQN